jgi:hypothetical protein
MVISNIFPYGDYLTECKDFLLLCVDSTCSPTSFATLDLYLQEINIMTHEGCRITKNPFGKYVYSTGVLLATLVYVLSIQCNVFQITAVTYQNAIVYESLVYSPLSKCRRHCSFICSTGTCLKEEEGLFALHVKVKQHGARDQMWPILMFSQ